MTPSLPVHQSIVDALSSARMATYFAATGAGGQTAALDLYIWNALLSSALFSSLHVCEVVIRNAISSALERKYGSNWPWHKGFEQTLPATRKLDLHLARQGIPVGATGKVIANLKFVFWSRMLTARHDAHVWNDHLNAAFPCMPYPLTPSAARSKLYADMELLRGLRNSIAHHEPVFHLPLVSYHERILRLIQLRSNDTAAWLRGWESFSPLLAKGP